jgi:hypothetical protein
LFPKKYKSKDSDPNAKGSGMVGGVEYWVSAWTNIAQSSGEKYQKLRFTPKEERGNDRPQQNTPPTSPVEDDDSSIPF